MKKHSAFSLIEMSIVIAIVGILIAGVAQASKMVKKSMLSTARTLTKRSVVNEMSGLVMWYETTLENSFIKTEMVDGVQVSTWYDNNPQAVTKTNATQSTTANKPIYTDNIINGLPALKFGGTKNFTTTNVCGQNYTIFVIFRTGVTTVNNYLTGWTLLLADATGVQYDTMPMVVAGSRPVVGSSKKIISGLTAIARASEARFCMPPESSEGKRSAVFSFNPTDFNF